MGSGVFGPCVLTGLTLFAGFVSADARSGVGAMAGERKERGSASQEGVRKVPNPPIRTERKENRFAAAL